MDIVFRDRRIVAAERKTQENGKRESTREGGRKGGVEHGKTYQTSELGGGVGGGREGERGEGRTWCRRAIRSLQHKTFQYLPYVSMVCFDCDTGTIPFNDTNQWNSTLLKVRIFPDDLLVDLVLVRYHSDEGFHR